MKFRKIIFLGFLNCCIKRVKTPRPLNYLETNIRKWNFIGALLSGTLIMLPIMLFMKFEPFFMKEIVPFSVITLVVFAIAAAAFSAWRAFIGNRWGWALIAIVPSFIMSAVSFIDMLVKRSYLNVEDKNYDSTGSIVFIAAVVLVYQLAVSLIVMTFVHYTSRRFESTGLRAE